MSRAPHRVRRTPLAVGRPRLPALRRRLPVRRPPLPLALLLVVGAALSLSWALTTPPLQGPDEAEHVAYVEHFAETGKLPHSDRGGGTYAPDEAGALGLGYLRLLQNRTVRPPWSPALERQFRALEDGLPDDARGAADGPLPTAENPPLYYAYESVGWWIAPSHRFFDRLFVLRCLSGIAFLAMILFAWLMAGELFTRRLPQTVAAAVVALLPMAGFMSGIVNSDILLASIFTGFGWVALRTVRLGLSWQRAAGLAFVAVLAMLTHGRGLAIMPSLPVVLLVAWLAHAKTLGRTVSSAAASVGVVALGFTLYRVLLATSASGGSVYGAEVNLGSQQGAFHVRELLSNIWQFYLPKLTTMVPRPGPSYGYRQFMVEQYLAGVFGSLEVYFPYWVYDTMQVAAGIVLVLVWTIAAVRWRHLRARWAQVVVVVAIPAFVLLLLHAAAYRALLNTGGVNPLLAGRYALPLTAFWGIAVATVVASVPRRAGTVLAAVVVIGLFALSLGALALNLERFYA
jgi:4-amino-4-deoxy-L-arabinose transferase-like glycosyltransferase